MIRDVKATAPSRPWFMWFCPGANHAPHHAPQEYIDKYKGKFDDGYEAYREWVLPRMIEKGILPEGTELTPINPMPDGTYSPLDMVRPWDSLSDDEKRLFSRMAEVYAGFSEYTDAPGRPDHRLPGADRPARQHDRHLLRRQRRVRRGQPERLGQREQVLQRLAGRDGGEPRACSTTSAARTPTTTIRPAGRWPSRRRSRCSSATRYQGGVCDPLVIHWPKGIKAKGEVRHQYHHAPTSSRRSSTCCGLEFPETLNGHEQMPLPGRVDALHRSTTPTRRRPRSASTTRCSARAASGRTAGRRSPCTGRPPGIGNFDKDEWELFHIDEDRAEAHDLADRAPREAASSSIDAWFEEAEKYRRAAARRPAPARDHSTIRGRSPSRRATRYVYYPDTAEVPGGGRRQHPRALVQDPRRRRDHEPRRRGRDLRPRLALRRPRAVPQGPEAALRLQLPRHPAGAAVRLRARSSPASTCSAWSSRRRAPGEHGESHRHDEAVRQRQGRRRGPMRTQIGTVHALRRRPVRRPRLSATP